MGVTVKTSTITGQKRGKEWQGLIDKFYRDVKLSSKNTGLRKKLLNVQKGTLVNTNILYDKIDEVAGAILRETQTDLFADTDPVRGEAGLQEGATGAKHAKVARDLQELANSAGLSGQYQLDHKDITPIGLRISALIDGTQELQQDLQAGNVAGKGNTLEQMGIARANTEVNRQAAIRELQVRIDTLKTARAHLDLIDKGNFPSEAELQRILVANNSQTPYSIVTTKKNDVNVMGSNPNLGEWSVEETTTHADKSSYQAKLGAVINRVMTGSNDYGIGAQAKQDMSTTDAELNRMFNTIVNSSIDIEGSKGIWKSIDEQLDDIIDGKKPRKTKSKTVTKRTYNNKMDLRKTKAELAKLKAKKRRVKKSLQAAASKDMAKKRIRSSSSDQAKAALHLKRLINRRLPAEVRRNMGRPALINRTGRFSNSVNLESLVPSKAGMVGKYSYLYRPYETFENTGKRKWPVGYNPKPLITKSIRNLAMQHMETKLTLKRT